MNLNMNFYLGLESHLEWEWLFRILCAGFLGLLIGYERHNRSKEAGIRTHAIVALSSALIMVVSKYGFVDAGMSDPARLAAQVVSGIGFLGAGIIFIKNDSVLGLTTAAGIWATSAVGLCLGAGFYVLGIASTVLILLVQIIARRLFNFSSPRSFFKVNIKIDGKNGSGTIKGISDYFKHNGLVQYDNKIYKSVDLDAGTGWALTTEVVTAKDIDPLSVIEELKKIPGVSGVELM